MQNQKDASRLQELQVLINKQYDGSVKMSEVKFDKIVDEHETLLANSWMDDNHLMTGAIDFIRQNIEAGDERIIYRNIDEHELLGEESQQIRLYHELKKQTKQSVYRVSYQSNHGHYVDITQYEATLRVSEDAPPYKVWRPFIDQDQAIKYKLIREVVVNKFEVDAAPAFLNYLIAQADGLLFKYLNVRDDFDEDFWSDIFTEVVLGERRLPNFNTLQTGVEHAIWLDGFKTTMASLDPNAELESVEAIIRPLAVNLYNLTSSVVADMNSLADENDADDELRVIDRLHSDEEVTFF